MYRIKNHITKLLLALTLLVLGSVAYAQQTWPPIGVAGNGTASNPYQIRTAQHLQALALFVNASRENAASTRGKHYRIMNDIDLTEF